eukprot:gene19101-23085_t
MHNVRTLEKLDLYQRFAIGSCDDTVLCVENDTLFLADINQGQKTGSFGIEAAKKGARQVVGIDRSKEALALAQKSATLNEVENVCTFIEGEAFEELAKLQGRYFDIVLLDPPAFVKSRKDLQAGLKGYSKLVRMAASLVVAQGLLSFTCCSHH